MYGAHPAATPEEQARQAFVSRLRAFVLTDLAEDMQGAFQREVRPTLAGDATGEVIHRRIRHLPAFQRYSAVRVAVQRMVWESVRSTIGRAGPAWRRPAGKRLGALSLNGAVTVPSNVAAIDVHLMPDSYVGQGDPDDLTVGGVFDAGMTVFAFGLLGDNLDEIGRSFARYLHVREPTFAPRHILDLGCTIGHNTLPWAVQFPEAEVHAIDVAAPMLSYAHLRAEAQGVPVHFEQMDATALDYPDESFDLVFSSMFLHELPLKHVRKVLDEARRVLRPGGIMLHMELPPNSRVDPYESFYLDWDCYYNAEPYYKAYRDQEPAQLCAAAGFDAQEIFEFAVAPLGVVGREAFDAAVGSGGCEIGNGRTGHFAEGIQWYGFGARKR